MNSFASFWDSGSWRKLGRVEAERRFKAQIKTEEDWILIQSARDAYNAYCIANTSWHTPMLGSVWFGRRKGWRDWIPDEVEAAADDRLPLFAVRQPHWCPFCPQPHSWDCENHPACCLSYEVCCPEFMARIEAKRKQVSRGV